jgi:hypothetical protein
MSAVMFAQGSRPASPAGTAATEVGGKYDPKAAEPTYIGGKWIEITYGRPIKRGRDVFGGTGANYARWRIQTRHPARERTTPRNSRRKCRW